MKKEMEGEMDGEINGCLSGAADEWMCGLQRGVRQVSFRDS